MVGVKMSDINQLQSLRLYIQCGQLREKLAERRTDSGIEQYVLPCCLKQETIHARRYTLLQTEGVPQRIGHVRVKHMWLERRTGFVFNPCYDSHPVISRCLLYILLHTGCEEEQPGNK